MADRVSIQVNHRAVWLKGYVELIVREPAHQDTVSQRTTLGTPAGTPTVISELSSPPVASGVRLTIHCLALFGYDGSAQQCRSEIAVVVDYRNLLRSIVILKRNGLPLRHRELARVAKLAQYFARHANGPRETTFGNQLRNRESAQHANHCHDDQCFHERDSHPGESEDARRSWRHWDARDPSDSLKCSMHVSTFEIAWSTQLPLLENTCRGGSLLSLKPTASRREQRRLVLFQTTSPHCFRNRH